MNHERKCREEGCTVEPIHSGLCEFHKWQRYHRNFRDKIERKKQMYDEKIKLSTSITPLDTSKREINNFKKTQRIRNFFYLYSIGYTPRKIADENHITRQRVFQILQAHPEWVKIKKHKISKPKIPCEECGTLIENINGKRRFCNRKCLWKWHYKNRITISDSERKRKQNERHKSYYHRVLKHNPEFKAKIKKYNDRAVARRIAEKQKRLEKARSLLSAVDPHLLRKIAEK